MEKADVQKSQRNRDLATIHIGAKQLGMDDAGYRAMLHTVAQVRSASDLDRQGRRRVITHLRQCGARFNPKAKTGTRYQRGSQAALIRHLWTCLNRAGEVTDGSDRSMRAWCKRESSRYHPDGVGYDTPQMMPPPVASKLIEHLKKWRQRVGVSD